MDIFHPSWHMTDGQVGFQNNNKLFAKLCVGANRELVISWSANKEQFKTMKVYILRKTENCRLQYFRLNFFVVCSYLLYLFNFIWYN